MAHFSLLVSVSHHKSNHLNQAWILSRVFKCDKMSVVSFPSKFAAERRQASSLGWLERCTQEVHCTADLQQKFVIWDTAAEVIWTWQTMLTVLQVAHHRHVPLEHEVWYLHISSRRPNQMVLLCLCSEVRLRLFHFIFLYNLCVQIFNNKDVMKRELFCQGSQRPRGEVAFLTPADRSAVSAARRQVGED